MKYRNLIFVFVACFIFSCEPKEDAGIDLGPLPEPPTFELEVLASNPNIIVVTSTANGFFDHVWDLPGGTPNRSTLVRDTVFYPSAGNYSITLHASKEGGNGTSSSSQSITIDQDGEAMCDPTTVLLTGDCTTKCWKLSEAPSSIKVGPVPFSAEWFDSPGLDPSQIDDRWCFTFEGGAHEYVNGGVTFSACQGFVEDPNYPIPANVSYLIAPSGSANSEFEILLDEGSWMGIEDTGPTYEIVSISEDEMVLLSPIAPCDGSPSPGWFTITFENE